MRPKQRTFNGVRIFSATVAQQRAQLGEIVSEWLARHPQLELRDLQVLQSSDSAFHCLSIAVFYWEKPASGTDGVRVSRRRISADED
jgi:hypothetical protein